MARVILVLFILGGVVAVASALATAIGGAADRRQRVGEDSLPARLRSTPVQKIAYGLLIAVMFGVASGLMST
ncbi:hypothetical protein DL237_20285 [Pseudooceanicola sediminis]|uniref:Uncharacterized protein n=1 Tax=Pseudooceanicola sediminis TaxID=2211117 RepID=A0A399J1M8_9RHOB|nr:hypothetical protein [Pseudooceanicola sediminis]RII36866.1 hypothetical protein DL237_20285 [Pseudooceanicola sediminis]|tara:strand:+ start:125153 stop:125368 length:216 start_codon:yes stop_codon:yes gene_type:complete